MPAIGGDGVYLAVMLRMLSDEELAFSAARRAQIPLTEDLYRGVFLPKIRFLKRRRFTSRLRGVLLHLSVESLGRALPERAELLRELVRQQSGFHQYMLDKLARLESNDFGPLNPRVAGVAAWALGTSKITLALAYLVSCLEKLSAGFDAEDAVFGIEAQIGRAHV